MTAPPRVAPPPVASEPATTRAAYFRQLGRAPAVINFVLNALIGVALFARRDLVPWTEQGSVGADLLFGGFIVAAISAWSVSPRVRRDAEAGLVAGRPAKSAWRVLPSGRTARAIALGFLVSIGLLLALVPLGEVLAPGGIGGWSAAAFKGVTSVLAGHLAILLAGNRALVGAPDRTAELAARPRHEGIPLEPLAKACVAGTSRAHGTTVAPTWELVVEGDLTAAQARAAFERVGDSFPQTRSVVVPVDALGDFATRLSWVDTGRAFPVVEAEGSASQVRGAALNHFIDLATEPPVRVVAAREDGRLHLFVQQHHAVADGRAFIDFLHTWGEAVRDVRAGRPSVPRVRATLPEAAAFDRTPAQLRATVLRGALRYARERFEQRRNPLPMLPWNSLAPHDHDDRSIHRVVPMSHLESWRARRQQWGVGLNALVAAAWLRAAARHLDFDDAALPIACNLAAETRPRDRAFDSFANHLSTLYATLDAEQLGTLERAARTVQAQSKEQVDGDAIAQRALFRGLALRLLPIDALKPRILDRPAFETQMGLSNVISIPLSPLEGEGWRVTRVRVTTPTMPPHGILLTAIRYGDEVNFNFNFDAGFVEQATVEALADAFESELEVPGRAALSA